MKKITLISDTHTLHRQVKLQGGDIVVCAGDVMGSGYYESELVDFISWFKQQDYEHKILIPGNHDIIIQEQQEKVKEQLSHHGVILLVDEEVVIDGIKIYGSPWQPWFHDWAYNLPRNGKELEEKWNLIPEDTDILVTHGPAYGYLDMVEGRDEHLGCELLAKRIEIVKPKIHVCGHIHSGRGFASNGNTNFINAALCNERNKLVHESINIVYDY